MNLFMTRVVLAALVVAACGGSDAKVRPTDPPVAIAARLPRAPGERAPSLVQIDRTIPHKPDDVSDGTMLSDTESCSTCHPDAAKQWATSPHSFASFGNPIYRFSVEMVRKDLGKPVSQHCGGCHDMPLMIDGLMAGDAPPTDLRSHSGVTCRLCHGIESVSKDGNGSYVWSRTPIDAPAMDNPSSIARHKQQVAVNKVGTEMCVGCHRGFLSPDMTGMPVHLSGLDEPGMWRNSAWTGNGMGRIDKVDNKTCIDCHMEREPASDKEYGAKHGTIASHRFLGGHTWMASMRGDADHLRRLQAKLEGIASIDIAGELEEGANREHIWHLPADGAPITPGKRVWFDVVTRNLLVGHRFPGGVLDIDDAWIEVEVHDQTGKLVASNGLTHATDPKDTDTHVMRSLVVDQRGEVLQHHEFSKMRTSVATQTLAAREAGVVRYAFDIPVAVKLPLTVTARLRHRTRTLEMQAAVCKEAQTKLGREFIAGARGARDVDLDPCKPQPITLIAQTSIEVGDGAKVSPKRPAWERSYEHGMALVATVSERLEEARAVLEKALAEAPDARARAMVTIQLGWVASKQGRADDALALVKSTRELLAQTVAPGAAVPNPPVLDAVATDALARVWRWDEAVAPAKACAEHAPGNSTAWMMYARVLGSLGNDRDALAAATRGLELVPRDPDLLRTQATALAALGRPEAKDALAAYERFRSPDNSAELRIQCAADSVACARDREQGQTLVLKPAR